MRKYNFLWDMDTALAYQRLQAAAESKSASPKEFHVALDIFLSQLDAKTKDYFPQYSDKNQLEIRYK